MNSLDQQYLALLEDILENGTKKSDRTGTGTLSVFGRTIRHSMKDGFPILTTKKVHFKSVVTELLWMLRGSTNIQWLVQNDCNIWVGDAYKAYEKHCQSLGITEYDDKATFIRGIKENDRYANQFGDLGPIYGKQWRSWGHKLDKSFKTRDEWIGKEDSIDQISNAIHDLKTNPDDRGIIVSAWNVGELKNMVLRPCHNFFQFYTRELSIEEKEWQLEKTGCINDIENDRHIYGHEWEKYIQDQYEGIQSTQGIKIPTRAISLMWNQRSCDFPLGIPYNITSYSLLLSIIAKEVNMVPDELVGSLVDCHIYLDQIEGVKEQLTRSSFDLPTLKIMENIEMNLGKIPFDEVLRDMTPHDFIMENYQSHPAIKFPLSN